MPSEFASASFIKSSQIYSDTYLLAPKTFFSSATDIYPLESSSKISKIFLILDYVIKNIRFVAMDMKLENEIFYLLNLLKISFAKK